MSNSIPITNTGKGFIKNQDFIEQLVQGDEQAFKALVEQFKDRVFNTCLGFLKNPQDAEDISQEVFIQVYDSIGDFRDEAELSTWIYRIAVTKSLEQLRYQKRKKRSGFFQAINSLFTEPDKTEDENGFVHPGIVLENKERAEILYCEIEKLTEKQRVAFTLHKIEGLSYKEVAKVMQLKLPAVESLMHRAKQNLQKGLYTYYQQNEMD